MAELDAVVANIDGASRGNPGEAGFGVSIRSPDGTEIAAFGDYVGRQTNNHAEYRGLLAALDWAERKGVRELCVRSDSELLVRQMNGEYRVKSDKLRPLYREASARSKSFERFRIEHVGREQNAEADELANRAIDERGSIEDPA